MDPLSAGLFASIGSAFKFADVAVRIAEVGNENAVFVRAICVVRSDLEEVERLLSMHPIRLKLTGLPGKRSWIMTAIQNAKCALNEIGKWVERARVEQETTGSIRFDTRNRWVFSDHEKLLNRQTELSTCHQQLSNVLGYLTSLEESPLAPTSIRAANSPFSDKSVGRKGQGRPQASRSKLEMSESGSNGDAQRSDGVQLEHTQAAVPPLQWDTWISADMIATCIDHLGSRAHDCTYAASSNASSSFPPWSPPPTYAAAVSTSPALHNVHSDLRSQTTPGLDSAITRSVDSKNLLSDTQNSTWAYRNDPGSTYVPELVGDTVPLHATNSTGPVNPYELYANADKALSKRIPAAQRHREDLAEMLGDIHFPAELPSREPGTPAGYPARLRTASEHADLTSATGIPARRRTTSDIPPRIRRRPLPTDTLSDSLLTVHENPALLAMHNSSSPTLVGSSHLAATGPTVAGLTTTLLADRRPASYTAHHSQQSAEAAVMNDPKHYSAPPPVGSSFNDCASAYSADSTSSWGLDTEPKGPKTRAEEPAKLTRMQSQMRIMDLLGSIDT